MITLEMACHWVYAMVTATPSSGYRWDYVA